jgi:FkbM family methyltransferase
MGAIKSLAKAVLPTSLWAKLRVYKIHKDIKEFEKTIVTHNYGGHDLQVHLEDSLARGWYDMDWAAVEEIKFLQQRDILTAGTKVFDLGAHQAVMAMMIGKAVGEEGRVLALEANSHNFRVANKNLETNGFKNINLINAAISNENGEIEFNEGLNGAVSDESGQWGNVKVPCYNLDTLMKDHFTPDVIYLDVEGFECIVMKGADAALSKKISWFIEMHGAETISNFGGKVEDILAKFPEDQFECFMAQEEEVFRPLEPKSPLLQERFFLIAIPKN